MKLFFVCVGLVLTWDIGCTGLQLAPCQSGVVEVLENSDSFSFTCDQYSGTVTWYYKTRTAQALEQTIGTCNASSCQPNTGLPSGLFSLTFVSARTSRLSLTSQTTARRYGITYRCADSQANLQCQVDVVSHAVVPPSGLALTTTRWNLQGSGDVTSVYSSLGRYSCSWTERSQTGQVTTIPGVTLTLTPDINDTSNTQNRTGTYTFSKSLPTDDGDYTYTVAISPGNTQRSINVKIVRPTAPTVTCSPSPYVLENTEVSCTCSTQSVGRPEGRLRWFRGCGNNNPINIGAYGGRSLIMTPQTLTLSDHDVTTFRCDVEWVESISGAAYTAQVGCKPRDFHSVKSTVIFQGEPVSVEFNVTAYPTPETFTFNYVGPTVTSSTQYTSPTGIDLRASCNSSRLLYITSCSIVVDNVTSAAASGFYRLTLTNSQGDGTFTFEVVVNEDPGKTTGVSGLAVGVGVTAALLLLLLVTNIVFCCWLWRRGWVMPCADMAQQRTHSMSAKINSGSDEQLQPVSSVQTPAPPSGPYDSLQMDDVGLRSPYAEIDHHGNRTEARQEMSQGADGEYEMTPCSDDHVYENNARV